VGGHLIVPTSGTATDGTAAHLPARLHYAGELQPCYRRIGHAGGSRIVDADGKPVRDPETLGRIRMLVIPPAWDDVRIALDPMAHLQATGRDARGRKQYRYHAEWRRLRDAGKFAHIVAFGKVLPTIRERVQADLGRDGLPRSKVLATIVKLLEATLIRIGNAEYARQNGSYGLTTLRNRHVAVVGSRLQFEFQAKSGKSVRLELTDRRLARIVRACRELPGQHLFQYLDDEGNRHSVGSGDVNDYLREASGQDFTAKDFRTWGGTVLAASLLLGDATAAAAMPLPQIVRQVAANLGNTPAVCRGSYMHPAIVAAATDATVAARLRRHHARLRSTAPAGLDPCEAAVLRFLIDMARKPPARRGTGRSGRIGRRQHAAGETLLPAGA
jgi:DNA topoisomerase-1